MITTLRKKRKYFVTPPLVTFTIADVWLYILRSALQPGVLSIDSWPALGEMTCHDCISQATKKASLLIVTQYLSDSAHDMTSL